MGKSLQEMPLDELWEQFPISLVPPGKDWERLYDGIRSILGIYPDKRISHTGSTAIHGIWTEDIVDVLVDVPALYRNVWGERKVQTKHIETRKGFIL